MPRHASTTFAERLKRAQKDAEIVTEDLTRLIDARLRTVQRWRAGQTEPDGESLARICQVLDKPVEFFYPDRDQVAA